MYNVASHSGVVERSGHRSIWSVWFSQTHESDQIHKREQSALTFHGPRFVSFADHCRNLLKMVIIIIARETDLFEGSAIWVPSGPTRSRFACWCGRP